ncbi:MAG: hypothetical protein ABIU11_00605 [Chitinophagaceae bacterium]
MLLSFLKISAIVNGKEIYPILNTKPVVITVQENNPKIVITDGYHITTPLKLVYKDLNTYCFKIVCSISDQQLFSGFIIMAILYLLGFYTGYLILKVFSFLPVIYLLFFFYLNRREFIKLIPVID